mmetsp:Transcript_1195/g.1692  ORF Transcript_1195/g.1692 Transcript_1195/m.1692 type:complete len:347 (-) Transcript_1195:243-1283(-)|eukprot:CAMPEP_0196584852 /NCGR_PEP_ID=MMETSP1081-20130531/48701_1 /TAXON_ID=36882 /ORGANISM="Pyramimonas amylifera, Strain CCMP720" /LENGTH=346 /DNA_ID=CAMNT_0041906209 /DNA_START=544 /DNA_END=1584 /DNA_ORIENTATION=+
MLRPIGWLGRLTSKAVRRQQLKDDCIETSINFDSLKEFEYKQVLGTGSFAQVNLVQHIQTGKLFALKVMDKQTIIDLRQVTHVINEKDILAILSHPNLVKLRGSFNDSTNIYLLLDFEPGGEFFSYLNQVVRVPENSAIFYVGCVFLALEYLHENKVVFRDVKPENLLLDSAGYLKLTDFGFAKYLPSSTNTLCGTPQYLAPEIVLGEPYGFEVDWWALGILMYEMIVGNPPFLDVSATHTYKKIVRGKFTFPSNISNAAKDLMTRLLKVNPKDRLGSNGSAEIKAHPWFNNFDWSALAVGELESPYVPSHDEHNAAQHFSEYSESSTGTRTTSLSENTTNSFGEF